MAVRHTNLTSTDELIEAYLAEGEYSRVDLRLAIPAAIDALYENRDSGGNMHSAGAAAAVAALDAYLYPAGKPTQEDQ